MRLLRHSRNKTKVESDLYCIKMAIPRIRVRRVSFFQRYFLTKSLTYMCSRSISTTRIELNLKDIIPSASQMKVEDNTYISNGKDRLSHIMQMYEDLVGLTEVKTAQDKVVEAEKNFLTVQEDRRTLQQDLIVVQNDVRTIGAEIEKMHRTDPSYVELIKKEHGILVVEKDMSDKLKVLDKSERDLFSFLSACVRESHEKERGRAERTKYWSIIGSVIGAIIGITGAAVNNHKRMKEMRALIRESGESSAEYKDIADKVLASLASSPILDLEGNEGDGGKSSELTTADYVILERMQKQSEMFYDGVNLQTKEILSGIYDVKKMFAGIQPADLNENIVYVGPEIQSLLQETELRLEKASRKNLAMSVCVIGVILSISISVVNFVFKGS